MSRETAFFSSDDPRPEFGGDPDDPRPEFGGDPDDPRPEFGGDPDDPRPEFGGDPDDPRPEFGGDPDDPRPEFGGDPDDPRPEFGGDPDDPRPEFGGDPDDPRPEFGGDPDDPRPEFGGDPDDPEVGRALETLNRKLGKPSCRRKRRSRCRRRRRPFPYQYSGNLVVRLSDQAVLTSDNHEKLGDLATDRKLSGLGRILERYGLTGHRLVDLEEDRTSDPDRDCKCGCGKGRCKCVKYPTVHQLERKAEASPLPPLHSLAAYWRLDVSDQPKNTEAERRETRINGWEPTHGQTVRAILGQLNDLAEVDRAYRELAVTDPAPPADANAYSVIQEYLNADPVGVNARWARAQMNGREEGVGLVDLEQGWIPHRDLADVLPPIFGDNRHGQGLYRGHHGTAVLGQIAALDNDEGVVGIVGGRRAARSVRVVSHYNLDEGKSLNVANAIRQAIGKMEAGDVLLLEVQRSYLPTEVDDADRDAIRLAVANGIVVIEAAGNGNADLDRYVDERGERALNRRANGFRESGAIMVGAALASRPHNRLWGRAGVGSNSGSRVDCFAQGNRVVTTGYGDLNEYLDGTDDEQADAERAYTTRFGGTSSAAPIIAGVALLTQAIHLDRTGARLSPWEMRSLLSEPRNGTRQGRGVRGRIGTMPDLKKILRNRLGLVSDQYLRDHLGDTGALPVRGRIAASPDILVVPVGTATPPAEEGNAGIEQCVPGSDYSVHVRAQNRGTDALPAEARAFWSEVATLITPAMWKPMVAGDDTVTAASAPVPAGGQPVWSDAIAWRPVPPTATSGDSPAHYCFMAVLEEPLVADENRRDPVLPPGLAPYFDWREYRAFLRAHNNVACSNYHLVASQPGSAEYNLEFAMTGTPDLARSFDFEIIRSLPDSARVELDAPLALASRLARGRLWLVEPQGAQKARIRFPSVPRLRIERLRLLAEARFDCQFRISGEGIEPGHRLAIRQLYRGEEVGRITWQVR